MSLSACLAPQPQHWCMDVTEEEEREEERLFTAIGAMSLSVMRLNSFPNRRACLKQQLT